MQLIQTARGIVDFLQNEVGEPEKADDMMVQVMSAINALAPVRNDFPEQCQTEFRFFVNCATIFINALRGYESVERNGDDNSYRLAYLAATQAVGMLDMWMHDHGFEYGDDDTAVPAIAGSSSVH